MRVQVGGHGEIASVALAAAFGAATGCAGTPAPRSEAPRAVLRSLGLTAPADPTVRPARLLPENLDPSDGFGLEPGKGQRAIVSGIRVASFDEGVIFASSDRLPSAPSSVVALPDRLGGGFLFAIGKELWRARGWLAPASPIFSSPTAIAQVMVGLDRTYVRTALGGLTALDPRTGAVTDLGPLPASPNIGRLAALDAWRAVAIADLRGALLTLDAGSTWRSLALPIDPSDLVVQGDLLLVGGADEKQQLQWWEVRPDGQTGRLPGAAGARAQAGAPRSSVDPLARVFGSRPLVATVEDGWPLVDGTALVARDGAVARVRLSDGALVESSTDAFGLKPARCHPLNLGQPADPGAFGFVCGEPRGRSIVYRWDAPGAHLVEMRRWDSPREVLAFGNGTLAVRGPCDPAGEGLPARPPGRGQPEDSQRDARQAYCLFLPGSGWSEILVPAEDDGLAPARLAVLSDRRMVLLHSPRGGDLSSAHLTVFDGARSSDIALAWPPLKPDAARVLRLGTWMDGFEERRPGVLGGWVEGAGTVVGLEIRVDGETRVGEYIHDTGLPVVSGRWGLGWTASRRGFETTDGGMTWKKDIDVPEPIVPSRLVHERACGPIGCIAAGWLRIGWGATESAPPPEPPTHLFRAHAPPSLDLDCRAVSIHPPEPWTPPAPNPPSNPQVFMLRSWAGARLNVAAAGYGTLSEFPPCLGRSGPSLAASDRGLPATEARDSLDRTPRGFAPLACVYAWGPKSGDWDQLGRWEARWLWPWGGWADVRSSASMHAPWTTEEAARHALGQGGGLPTTWVLAPGDDADHALLIARHTAGTPNATAEILALESDRAPSEVRRPGGDAFADVEGATRVSGRWYVSTGQSPGELAATVVWLLDGATAREVARFPRAGFEGRPTSRLARRADGRAVGVVVDGQPDTVRGTAMRWVAGIDLESGAVSDPEPLAPVDFSDREVSLCTGDDGGWVLDLAYPGSVRLHGAASAEASLQSVLARARLTRDRMCVERLIGSVDSPPEALNAPEGAARARAIDVSVVSGRARYALRCSKR